MRRCAVILVVCVLVTPGLWAGELSGVTIPDSVTVNDTILKLNGMGLRKKLWVEVYVAGLYLANPTGDALAAINATGPKRVVMHFRTDRAKKKKMDAAWLEGFKANSPGEFSALEGRVKTFMDFFGDMKVDNIIELTVVPGRGTIAVYNGKEKGVIEGDDFGIALLSVWLGDHPPADGLKAGLLGK